MGEIELRMDYTYEGDKHSILYLHPDDAGIVVLSGYGEVIGEFKDAGEMARFLVDLEDGALPRPKILTLYGLRRWHKRLRSRDFKKHNEREFHHVRDFV